jgi:thiamine-monophosphate kinase
MACLPAAALLSVALPRGTGLDYAKELYLGLRQAADRFECAIVGGDTATWTGKLAMSVTILGRSAGITPIPRSGARPGDGIYVTGSLGASIFGRHMTFSPRIPEARQLAASGVVTAMLDISDGLSRDLPRICSDAILEAAAIPIHPDVEFHYHTSARESLHHALHDGEDYELLFSARAAPPLGTQIGTVTAAGGLQLRHVDRTLEPLHPQGWEHPL